jgi:hypothetical protein
MGDSCPIKYPRRPSGILRLLTKDMEGIDRRLLSYQISQEPSSIGKWGAA